MALSPATVYKHLNLMSKVFGEAARAGVINRNPTDLVSAPSLKGRKEQRALDDHEIVDLLEAAKDTRYDAPIRFTLATGRSLGEFLSLQWNDLYLHGRSV